MRKTRGVTLIELLIVIAVIGILVGLSIPAVQAARESARNVKCKNRLRQIGIAINTFNSSRGHFPPGWTADTLVGVPGWGWAAHILPYMEQNPLSETIHYQANIEDPLNDQPRQQALASFLCPTDYLSGQLHIDLEQEQGVTDPYWDDHLPLTIAAANYVGSIGAGADLDDFSLGFA